MNSLKSNYDTAIRQLTQTGAPFEVVHESIAGVSQRVYRNAPATLTEIYAQARTHGLREFLVFEGERWSFADLFAQADAIAAQLVAACGIGKGEHVAIAMRNYPEWMSAFIAITSIGAVAVPVNSWGQPRELEFALRDAAVHVVFCDQQRLDAIAPFLGALGARAIVARPDPVALPPQAVSLADFIAGASDAQPPHVALSPDDAALMMYTSGTTGKPKGALSTHRALCQAVVSFECAGAASAMINPDIIATMMARGFAPVQMLAVPLFHVSGCHAVFLTALRAGRKIVMLYKWDVERALQAIERERVTILSAAPSMLLQLLESPLFATTDTASLCSIGGGGSATPARVARLIEEKMSHAYPGTGWGMTETNAIGSAFTGAPFRAKPGSAGFLHPTVDVSVRDADGIELPQGVAGNLWIKTPTLINEYWRRPEANAREFRAGWFDSGDIGYFDEEGYLFLSDRAKDMVIRGGENIYPAEIEAVLLEHPAVEEVAAFGVADETLGEQLAVAILTKPGALVDAQAIRSFAAARLARFKVPHHIWLRGEPLPRNAAGKVLKNQIKSEFAVTQGGSA